MSSLVIRSLGKSYGEVEAVKELSLSVEPGQVHGLLGPNGSGKTTTLSCALGLLRPTRGEVQVLGVPASALYRTKGRVGVVFDRPVLLPRASVRSNLRYAAVLRGHAGGRSDDEVLELVGLTGLARRRAGGMSLGQKKRLSLAMALAGDPELIVLDEPLSGLDPVGTRQILELIGHLAEQGLTLVLSSHRLHDVEPVLTHATIMIRGRRVAHGPMESLLGKGANRVRVEVDEPARAAAVIEGHSSWQLTSRSDSALDVELGVDEPPALARALVEAGVGLRGLAPAGERLADAFDRLVEREVTEE